MDAEDLYGLPLERFVAQRGALVKSLRADGRRDEAAAVGALRKPSVAAWVVNQLVRARPRELAELFAAGDALREAQSGLLAGGGDRNAMRTAAEQERAAVEQLVGTAGGLLSAEGTAPGPVVLDRVADTLHAAALDDQARAQVRDGTLVRELRHVGLGPAAVFGAPGPAPPAPAKAGRARGADRPDPPKPARAAKARQAGAADGPPPPAGARTADGPPPPAGTRKADERDRRRAEREQAARDRVGAQERERERAGARRAAKMAEATARRELERAESAVRHAQDQRERAVRALAAADEELAGALERAEAAAAAHRRAASALD